MRDSRLRPPRGMAGQMVNSVLLTDPPRGVPSGAAAFIVIDE